jgi:hypothetical protein
MNCRGERQTGKNISNGFSERDPMFPLFFAQDIPHVARS